MKRWEQVEQWVQSPKMGVELGVMRGQFTAYMLGTFPSLHLVAVDLWAELPRSAEIGADSFVGRDWRTVIAEFRANTAKYAARLTVLRMDTVAAAERFADGTFDFVFIDATHTYTAVKADIAAWRPKVRPGGILCGHDYTHPANRFPGVKRAVDEVGLPVVTGDDATWMIQL